MFKTRITEMLGIEYPILMGGMQWLSRAEFVASVSNAGGTAFITAVSFPTIKELRAEIRKAKDLTDKPFGVNISMLPGMQSGEITNQYFELVVEEGVKFVETSGRSPEAFIPPLKEAGVKVIHKVPAIRYAKKAEKVGADAVTVVGFECGGHPGMDDVTSLVLLPRAAQEIKIPIVAAGGFADGGGLVSALALGADAIMMGTRFMATKECMAHDAFKDWLIKADETSTMIIERSIRNAARVIKNKAAQEVLEMENKGATLAELMTVIAGKIGLKALKDGDIEGATIACGQCVGLINDVPTVKELIDRIVSEAEEAQKRVNTLLN